MNILVIYDSYFGNTGQIGQAIAKVFSKDHQVQACHVSELKPEQMHHLDLLVVGSPTRGFQPTEKIKKFISSLTKQTMQDLKVAAFDTGIAVQDVKVAILRWLIKVAGYAAKPIAKSLVKKGGCLVVPPEEFWVLDEKGPLKAGELARAESWANKILEKAQ